jgi:hypothetical protein
MLDRAAARVAMGETERGGAEYHSQGSILTWKTPTWQCRGACQATMWRCRIPGPSQWRKVALAAERSGWNWPTEGVAIE